MKMKKRLLMITFALVSLLTLVACNIEEKPDYSGVFTGYSWAGEATGVKFEDATQRIRTTLYIAKTGVIAEASMDFEILRNGVWVSRLITEGTVSINYDVTPVAAIPSPYTVGTTMFNTGSLERMSLYAVGVSPTNTVALMLVDPVTRYQFEYKLNSDFDYTTPVSALTIGSGLAVPAVRTAGGANLNVTDWATLSTKHFFNINTWSHVSTDVGVLAGVTGTTSVKAMLEKLGVTFTNNLPQAMDPVHGYLGLGGWGGNYEAVRQFLIGKSALEVKSLVDWTDPKYANSINELNQFGLISGATATAQDSFDTIAGATIRMSRESTSYQRALVAAGLLDPSQVIIGRF
jgi:hypothetical protein